MGRSYAKSHRLLVVAVGDERACTATVVVDENEESPFEVGTSSRDPKDPYDPDLGADLAIARAVKNLGTQMLKEAQARVNEQDRKIASQADARERRLERKNAHAKKYKTKDFTSKFNTVNKKFR